eukprot:3320945-Alexandrium_andersonii.AAC.1
MSASLVGSEMCIRDSHCSRWCSCSACPRPRLRIGEEGGLLGPPVRGGWGCLLYTSDAADDM